MRYVCLLISMLPAVLFAQDGGAIYKERCASCHDAPQERVPSIATIKAMSGEAIYLALTNGVMKSRAEGLSTTQIFALIGYIAPTGGTQPAASFEPTCKGAAAFRYGAGARNGTAGARVSQTRASRTRRQQAWRRQTSQSSS